MHRPLGSLPRDARTSWRAATLLAVLTVVLAGCSGREGDAVAPPGPATGRDEPASRPLLVDVTDEMGLAATRSAWPDGSYNLPEIMQGGVALLDYDGDGDLDLLHVRVPRPDDPGEPAPNHLYRLDDGRFTEVGARAGIADPGFGQGVAVGDTDNDGDLDVYVTNHGADAFFRNRGDGTFEDATAAAGFSGERWSSSATFCDYDRDGFLDLYVVHYLRYDPDTACVDDAGRHDYCGPASFPGDPDTLYRNRGDGTFEDVTLSAGLRLPEGGARARGLGVICADMTEDGLADFFVANDGESNQLWVNAGDGSFEEQGILRGVAVSGYGKAEASMGVALGDVDGDGVEDLFMTHLAKENNRLYMGGRLFADRSRETGLSSFDLDHTGFGCGFLDLDHDGDLDLAVANGAVRRRARFETDDVPPFWRDYAQPNQLFMNGGGGTFGNAEAEAGAFASTVEVSRALAFGDLDRDGDVDIVVSNADNSLRVYRNDGPAEGSHWLQVRAVTGGRDALGARVTVRAGDAEQSRVLLAGYSYLTSSQPVAHFGLAAADRVDGIDVLWPGGRRESFPGGDTDRVVVLTEGSGTAP